MAAVPPVGMKRTFILKGSLCLRFRRFQAKPVGRSLRVTVPAAAACGRRGNPLDRQLRIDRRHLSGPWDVNLQDCRPSLPVEPEPAEAEGIEWDGGALDRDGVDTGIEVVTGVHLGHSKANDLPGERGEVDGGCQRRREVEVSVVSPEHGGEDVGGIDRVDRCARLHHVDPVLLVAECFRRQRVRRRHRDRGRRVVVGGQRKGVGHAGLKDDVLVEDSCTGKAGLVADRGEVALRWRRDDSRHFLAVLPIEALRCVESRVRVPTGRPFGRRNPSFRPASQRAGLEIAVDHRCRSRRAGEQKQGADDQRQSSPVPIHSR